MRWAGRRIAFKSRSDKIQLWRPSENRVLFGQRDQAALQKLTSQTRLHPSAGKLAAVLDHVLSTHAIGTFKPDPRAYQLGIRRIQQGRQSDPRELTFVPSGVIGVLIFHLAAIEIRGSMLPSQGHNRLNARIGMAARESGYQSPSQRGVLYDLPIVVAEAKPVFEHLGVADRCDVVGGNFFRRCAGRRRRLPAQARLAPLGRRQVRKTSQEHSRGSDAWCAALHPRIGCSFWKHAAHEQAPRPHDVGPDARRSRANSGRVGGTADGGRFR